MNNLIIDKKNTLINIQNNRLLIGYSESNGKESIPLNLIDSIVFISDVQISTSIFNQFAKHNISVCFIASKHELSMNCYPHNHGNIDRKINQFNQNLNQEFKLIAYKKMLNLKAKYQIRALKKLSCIKPSKKIKAIKQINFIKDNMYKINNLDSSESLMGIEGYLSKEYFKGYKLFFKDSLHFDKRLKRPSTDPVNSVLNLTYMIIYYEFTKVITSYGYEPQLGFIHAPAYGRNSLSSDLMEWLRPLADLWVFDLFNNRVLTESLFTNESTGLRLNKTGRSKYYSELKFFLKLMQGKVKLTVRMYHKYIGVFDVQ